MKKLCTLLCIFLLSAAGVAAQDFIVTGTVTDKTTKEPIELVTVQLLRTDSTMVTGESTSADGNFRITTKKPGKYIVKVSYVSYLSRFFDVQLTRNSNTAALGSITLETNDVALKQALVTKVAARVEQVGDTTMFNAAAYRTPEGATLEALVKQLPGVEVSDEGKIKWNGKEVQEFLVNGKDFFKGDTKIAMKNLPADMVSKLKAYDKKSDYTELTGIDDGEETTVLDISTKRALNESWITNIDGGYGTEDRYSTRIFASRFTERTRVTAFGSMNNTGDRGFGGRGFGGGAGLTASKSAGLSFNWENDKKKKENHRLEVSGDVNWSHTDTDVLSKSSGETFLAQGGSSSFNNSHSMNENKSTSVHSNFRLKWHPDSMTRINLRPNFSFSKSSRYSESQTATFNDDPYLDESIDDPLDSLFNAYGEVIDSLSINHELKSILVNTNTRRSLGDTKSTNTGATFNLVRNLGNKGRNISVDAGVNWSKSESESFSKSDIYYYQQNGGKNSKLNQYTTSPSKNWGYNAGLSYSEPLTKEWHLQLRYNFSYKYSDSDRELWDLAEDYSQKYPLGYIDEAVLAQAVRDDENSQYATYEYFNHRANLGIRYNTKTIKFNAGVNFDPETTKMDYKREGQNIDTVITRNVFNVSPQVRFRYNKTKNNRLEIYFRGSSSQPSMTNLLDVVDDSNPLSVSMSNPGLKPSWNNNARFSFNGFNPESERGYMVSANWSQTLNSVSTLMVYDEKTGVSYTRPTNINGKWNANGNVMFNTSLGKKKLFSISTYTNLNYNNDVGYVSNAPTTTPDALPGTSEFYREIFRNARSEKSTTRSLGVGEMLNATYRVSWFDIGLNGNINYQHSRNDIQKNANLDTWNFSYGANANFNFSWGMGISTDINMSSRRGYAERSMNTNELIWNAQISQSFLKNRAATISLKFYDILQQQSNVSRSISAHMRSDTWNNAINSYCMLHFTYRLNIFSGGKKGDDKKGDKTGKGERPQRGPGNFPAGRPMMPPPGGRFR